LVYLGFHVLAIDYRGYGLSTGTPNEEGVLLDSLATLDYSQTQCPVLVLHAVDDDVCPHRFGQELWQRVPSHVNKDLVSIQGNHSTLKFSPEVKRRMREWLSKNK
jgi:alpha-beta hydrolase superfamily lysophospholipase